MNAPLIALPMRVDQGSPNWYLQRQYAEALYRCGAIPVYVPLITEADFIQAIVLRSEAVVLTGSASDLDPSRYNQEPHSQLRQVMRERDEVDFLLLQAAEERELPVLAICFGCQSLNVHRGGSLIQDIPSQVEGAIKHEQDTPVGALSHSVELKADSILARLAGSTQARVNSSHHQSIEQVGAGLEPIAWAPDGVIEAVVNTSSEQLILGVQWHPERSFDSDAFSQNLFAWFVDQVKERDSSSSPTRVSAE